MHQSKLKAQLDSKPRNRGYVKYSALAFQIVATILILVYLGGKLDDYVKNVPSHVQAARKAEVIRDERKLPSLYKSGGWIEYLMTTNGPEPRQYRQASIDFDFYIDKQLTPIADAILIFKSSSMNDIINQQIGLF